jgi:hypothetical protein
MRPPEKVTRRKHGQMALAQEAKKYKKWRGDKPTPWKFLKNLSAMQPFSAP